MRLDFKIEFLCDANTVGYSVFINSTKKYSNQF